MQREDWDEQRIKQAEAAIGYTFRDKSLLQACFTHKSYSNVFPTEKDNERLEFLGDAVLSLCVSENLYLSSREDEGKLTDRRQSYVSEAALSAAEKQLGLMRFLRACGGKDNLGGKTASNLFEAVVAGIYLDGGIDAAKEFLRRSLVEEQNENYKRLLQEFVQDEEKTLPVYRTEAEGNGFVCKVTALNRSGTGRGSNKQTAEQNAAKSLYEQFREGKYS